MGTGDSGPLTQKGIELLKEFDRLGMILDATHSSDPSFYQAMELFHGPVMASHNNCRALVPGDRQFSDEQIRLLVERDAVIGVAFDSWMLYPGFVIGQTHGSAASLTAVADHIDHICQLAGKRKHIALGTDLDGGFGTEQSPPDWRPSPTSKRSMGFMPSGAILLPTSMTYFMETGCGFSWPPCPNSHDKQGVTRITIMNDRDQKLESLGYPLDKMTPEGSLVDVLAIVGNIIYASGQVPFDGNVLVSKGKVPSQVSAADATVAASLCAANVLRAVRHQIRSLDRIERVIRITGYVNADPDFTDEHLVINGDSQLVLDVFGKAGRHARTALGMGQLPLGASVEVEMILKLAE